MAQPRCKSVTSGPSDSDVVSNALQCSKKVVGLTPVASGLPVWSFAGFAAVHMRPIGSSDLSADVTVSLDGYLCGPVMEWQLVHSFNATWHRLQSNGGIDAID